MVGKTCKMRCASPKPQLNCVWTVDLQHYSILSLTSIFFLCQWFQFEPAVVCHAEYVAGYCWNFPRVCWVFGHKQHHQLGVSVHFYRFGLVYGLKSVYFMQINETSIWHFLRTQQSKSIHQQQHLLTPNSPTNAYITNFYCYNTCNKTTPST